MKVKTKTDKIKDIKRIANKMRKEGFDDLAEKLHVSNRMKDDTINDLWLHATKNTDYKLKTLKDEKGGSFKVPRGWVGKANITIRNQSKSEDVESGKKNGKVFYKNKKGAIIAHDEAVRSLLAIQIENMQYKKEREMKAKNPAYQKAFSALSALQKQMETKKISERSYNIATVEPNQQKALNKNASKVGDAKALKEGIKNIATDALVKVATGHGSNSKVSIRLSEMTYEDIYALQEIYQGDFWRAIYYIGVGEDVDRKASEDELTKMINEYEENLKESKEKGHGSRKDLALGTAKERFIKKK